MTTIRRPDRSEARRFLTPFGVAALAGATEAAERLGGSAEVVHGIAPDGSPRVGLRIGSAGTVTARLGASNPRAELLRKAREMMKAAG